MKNVRFHIYPLVFLCLMVVCMTLFAPLSPRIKLLIRVLLLSFSIIAWRIFIIKKLSRGSVLAFSFIALNLAFLIVTPFSAGFWNLDVSTSRGMALSKFSDSAIISIVLIASFLVAGYRLKSIYLTSGKLLPGIITGVIFILMFGCLALNINQQKPEPGFLGKNWFWILIFVLSNGFMEELVFRGIFLEKLNLLFNHHLSILLCSVCFAVPHIMVKYQPEILLFTVICFFLGMICGYAMYYTRSIIAPALIHAGADLVIIVPIFATYGVK